MTEFVRFYKIKYQWMIRIHNVYEVGVIELSGSKSSKDIEDYFYDVGDLIKIKRNHIEIGVYYAKCTPI